MGAYSGPEISNDGLVFHLDSFNPKNFSLIQANNLYTNGNFSQGLDILEESGSNPTNEIVKLNNPGDSPYVLRQRFTTTNATEYQIGLSNLSPSTTYVLSGWYAESLDYSGNSRMFHCRAFSAAGSHPSLGTGIGGQVGDPVVIDGITWTYRYATITTPSDATGLFHWYVGYEFSAYSGYRYYTNLRMEEGTFPSPIDFANGINTTCVNGITYSNGSYLFDGTNDYIDISTYQPADTTQGTIEVVFKTSSNHRGALLGWGDLGTSDWGSFEIGPSSGSYNDEYISYINGDSGYTLILFGRDAVGGSYKLCDGNYHHIVARINGSDNALFVDGERINVTFGAGSSSTSSFIDNNSTNIRVGNSTYNGGHIPFNGIISFVKIYEKGLTDKEVKNNYLATKSRYGL